ncbi:MAG: hypothetical protein ACFFB0_09945 [Promethearchaeota archaeon]
MCGVERGIQGSGLESEGLFTKLVKFKTSKKGVCSWASIFIFYFIHETIYIKFLRWFVSRNNKPYNLIIIHPGVSKITLSLN